MQDTTSNIRLKKLKNYIWSDNMSPYISIIMAVYNNEKYFPIAVNSIINQTFTDWELVIVDDGSTDRTPQIADDFANQDNRIKVIHQENQWIFRSYNNGYTAATGKYVFIVNSDDTINPESLQRIHDVAEIDDADMIMFNLQMYYCDNEQNIIGKILNESNEIKNDFSYSSVCDIHNNWVEFLQKEWIGHQCVYKTDIAKKILYRTDTYAGDFFYNIDIADQLNVVAGTSYPVYNHFAYINNNLNASKGKYYGYEHNMFNSFYSEYQQLFIKWNKWERKELECLSSKRLRNLTFELKSYSNAMCPLEIDKKLEKILTDLSDNVVYNCAMETDRIEEYESRVLSGFREIFIKEIPSENCKYYFFYELLDRLLAYEKTDEDMKIIKQAVYNQLNPHNIGECFYKKLTGERVNRNV